MNEYDRVKSDILDLLERDWGPRCDIKDTEEFDDLGTENDPDAGRCPTCLVYDKFDNFWNYISLDEDD